MANPTEAAARAAILAVQPSATITTSLQFSATVAAGLVISIDPPVGSLTVPDATINLVVSRGPFPASRWTGETPEVTQGAVVAASVDVAPPPVVMAMLVFLDIPDDPVYVTDAGSNLNWDGHEWIGVGQLGSIEGPDESLDAIAQPFKLTLSGVDPALIASANSEHYAGRDAIVYMALLDPDTYAFLDEPTEHCSGEIAVMTFNADRNQASVVVEVEHRLRRLPITRRWTDPDQRTRHASDRFFEFVKDIRGYVSGGGGRDISYGGTGRNRDRANPRPY